MRKGALVLGLLFGLGWVAVLLGQGVPFGAGPGPDGLEAQSKPLLKSVTTSGLKAAESEQFRSTKDGDSSDVTNSIDKSRNEVEEGKFGAYSVPTWKTVSAKRIASVEKELSNAMRIEEFQPGANPVPAGCFTGSTLINPREPENQYRITLFLLAVNSHPGPVNFPVEGWRVDDLSYLHISSKNQRLWSIKRENNPQFLRTIDGASNGYFLGVPNAFIIQLLPKAKTESDPAGYIGSFYFYSRELNGFHEAMGVQLELVGGDVCIAEMHG